MLATGVIFRNAKKQQVATKLPLSGTFDNTNSDTWYAIIDLLRNAFIQALQPSIDAEINIQSVDKANEERAFLKKCLEIKAMTKKNKKP